MSCQCLSAVPCAWCRRASSRPWQGADLPVARNSAWALTSAGSRSRHPAGADAVFARSGGCELVGRARHRSARPVACPRAVSAPLDSRCECGDVPRYSHRGVMAGCECIEGGKLVRREGRRPGRRANSLIRSHAAACPAGTSISTAAADSAAPEGRLSLERQVQRFVAADGDALSSPSEGAVRVGRRAPRRSREDRCGEREVHLVGQPQTPQSET